MNRLVDNLKSFCCLRSIHTIAYGSVLALAAGYIAVLFMRPVERHWGINPKHQFNGFVDGTAYRPFAYRALFPTTVRLISKATPATFQRSAARFVERHYRLRRLFAFFEWDSLSAFRFGLAAAIIFLSFAGAGHAILKLALATCTIGWNFTQAAVVLFFVGIVAYQWHRKSPFLRTALLWTAVPLLVLTFFMGLIDEWRDYYEAYPPAFCCIVSTVDMLRKRSMPAQTEGS